MNEKPADSTTSADLPLPYADRPVASAPGHWVLARAGKRVLRPGGAALSAAMLGHAHLAGADVVELAPGLGRTAAEVIKDHPASYTAIDRDPDAARRVAAVVGDLGTVRQGEAADTGLDDASADVVVGEAMLTMQGDKGKAAIVAEAPASCAPAGATPSTSSASPPMTSTRSTTPSCAATWPAPSTSTPAP